MMGNHLSFIGPKKVIARSVICKKKSCLILIKGNGKRLIYNYFLNKSYKRNLKISLTFALRNCSTIILL